MEREHVVEHAIAIGKLDRRADPNREHMRTEGHVPLIEYDLSRLAAARQLRDSSHTTALGSGRSPTRVVPTRSKGGSPRAAVASNRTPPTATISAHMANPL